MKTLPASLRSNHSTVASGLRVIRNDAQVFGFSSHDVDTVIDGVTYRAFPGLNASSIATSVGFDVDNLELTTLNDGTVFTLFDVLSGVWRNAEFLLFRFNWASPEDGIDPQMAGVFGEVQVLSTTVVAELRGLQQFLQQPVGNVSTQNCKARLGDDRCKVDLSIYTFTGTLTGVTSKQVFRDSARDQPVDYFTEGTITFNSGALAGLSSAIKAYAVDGTFTVKLPFVTSPAIGDTYTAIAGCTWRLAEDCGAKFDNVLNFQGEPHRPPLDDLTSSPTADV